MNKELEKLWKDRRKHSFKEAVKKQTAKAIFEELEAYAEDNNGSCGRNDDWDCGWNDAHDSLLDKLKELKKKWCD